VVARLVGGGSTDFTFDRSMTWTALHAVRPLAPADFEARDASIRFFAGDYGLTPQIEFGARVPLAPHGGEALAANLLFRAADLAPHVAMTVRRRTIPPPAPSLPPPGAAGELQWGGGSTVEFFLTGQAEVNEAARARLRAWCAEQRAVLESPAGAL